MALTLSNQIPTVFGNKRAVICDIAFDSSYAFGGESLDPATASLLTIAEKAIIEGKDGYQFDYDYTNKKVRVFAPAPPIVVEEKHTASSNLITLDYPAAWIVNVCQAGQNMQWAKVQAAADLSANQFCLVADIADGVRTQIYTDGASDVVYVTYVTQAWHDLYMCLVQEEAVTLATGANNLANTIMGFGFCHAATSGALTPVDIADTTGDGEVGVKFNYATGALDANAAQNTEAAVVTYLKKPSSGFIVDRFIPDEDATKSGSDPYLNTLDRPLLLWLTSGFATFNGQTTCAIIEEDGTPATGEVNTKWLWPGIAPTGAAPAGDLVIGGKDNISLTAAAYLFGHAWEIPGLKWLEVRNGVNLSGLTGVKALLIGT